MSYKQVHEVPVGLRREACLPSDCVRVGSKKRSKYGHGVGLSMRLQRPHDPSRQPVVRCPDYGRGPTSGGRSWKLEVERWTLGVRTPQPPPPAPPTRTPGL